MIDCVVTLTKDEIKGFIGGINGNKIKKKPLEGGSQKNWRCEYGQNTFYEA